MCTIFRTMVVMAKKSQQGARRERQTFGACFAVGAARYYALFSSVSRGLTLYYRVRGVQQPPKRLGRADRGEAAARLAAALYVCGLL